MPKIDPSLPGFAAWYDPATGEWRAAWATGMTLTAKGAAELRALPTEAARILARCPGSLAVGILSYRAGLRLHNLDSAAPATLPDAVIYLYPPENHWRGSQEELKGFATPQDFRLTSDFASELAEPLYESHFQRIREYLLAGDCYQVNYTRRFAATCAGPAFAAWLKLIRSHPAPHASFFSLPNGDAVFGVSPERFLHVQGRRVITEPIKGSRPRGNTSEEDAALAQGLQASSKDQAENLMIVDLLRNDLGRICLPGTVTAPALFELRRFSNVQHLVSTVEGKLREDVLPLEALLSCSPGGSITGAPKRRAMEIIEELEPHPRGFYCGSQFWMDGHGNLDSNILIRTFQTQGSRIFCHGGGGITAGSDARQEFLESEFKIAKLMATLTQP